MEARHLLNRILHRCRGLLVVILAAAIVLVPAPWNMQGAVQQQQGVSLPDDFHHSVYVSGLNEPAAMALAPDGRLFVAERAGTLRVVKDGELVPTPFLSVEVTLEGERGLVGVTVDPDFKTNGYVYVFYTHTGEGENEGISRISRFTADPRNPDVAQPGSELRLLELANSMWHNGGALRFGPDGMLYFTVGDNNNRAWSQSLESLAGKVGRIDPASYPDLIPPDNPFVDTPGARPEIYALGLRNPFTLGVEPENGRILVNTVGDYYWEEINKLEKGANYGWPWCEGEFALAITRACPEEFTAPLFAYPHVSNEGQHEGAELIGCAIIGGDFYRGGRFPAEYNGRYFFTDHCAGWIGQLTPDNEVMPFATGTRQWVTSLVTGPDGIYYTGILSGEVYRISYEGPPAKASAALIEGPELEVSFSVEETIGREGEGLSYTWDFGDGATGTGPRATHRYGGAGMFDATLTVSGPGGVLARDVVRVAVGLLPTSSIQSPDGEGPFSAGDVVRLAGTAADERDGELPDEAFTWEATLHDGDQTIPVGEPLVGQRRVTFTVPEAPTRSAEAFYRIRLTVINSLGLSRTSSFDIPLNTVTTRVETEPAGLIVLVDGQTVAGPHAGLSVAGARRVLGVPLLQRLDGAFYRFAGWAEGIGEGPAARVTPTAETVYAARFEPFDPASEELAAYDEIASWANHSWGTDVNRSVSTPTYTGTSSMAVRYRSPWSALSLQTASAVDTSAYTHVEFAVFPGEMGLPRVAVRLQDAEGNASEQVDIDPYARLVGDDWYLVRIPLADLGAENMAVTTFQLREALGIGQPTFYLDHFQFVRRSRDEAIEPELPVTLAALPTRVFAAVPADVVWPDVRDTQVPGPELPGPSGVDEQEPPQPAAPAPGGNEWEPMGAAPGLGLWVLVLALLIAALAAAYLVRLSVRRSLDS